MGRPKAPKPKKGVGSSLKEKAVSAAKNALTDQLEEIFDPTELQEESEENKFGPTEVVLPLGDDWGIVATPGGPVDPWDCERWPGSPYCGGGFNPTGGALGTGIGLGDIQVDGCGIMVSLEWSVLGFEMPLVSFGIQSSDAECQPNDPEPEPPNPGGGGSSNWPDPIAVPFPSWNSQFLYALVFHTKQQFPWQYPYTTYFAWGPVGIQSGEIIYDNRYNPPAVAHRRYYLLCNRIPATDGRLGGLPRVGNSYINGPDDPELFDDQMFPYLVNYIGQEESEVRRPPFSIAGPPLIPSVKTERMNGGTADVKMPAQNFGRLDPGSVTLVKTRIIGCYGRFSNNYISQVKARIEAKYNGYGWTWNGTIWEEEWNKLKQNQPPDDPYFARFSAGGTCEPGNSSEKTLPEGLNKIRKKKKMDCCELVLINARRLRRIEAVLQPGKFLKFNESGKPEEVIGKIPQRLLTPGGEGYEKLAGYSDALEALVRMVDRISGFWPATVEIEDIDPNTPGNQSFSLQVHSISDAFKQALEALAQLMIKTPSANQPQQPDEDDPTFKILAAILTEVGLTHKIAAITQHTTNNIEEFLDYKVRQQEEILPMAFNPLVEPTWKNLEYTKPTKGQLDLYIKQLLTPSTQDIVVTKNEETKFFTEWMMELLKHSSAASAALTQQIKSKEDLKKALGTARFNALVAGALNMEQIRRVLGLPSNWDLEDFADNLEDNFHPDENVESGLHAETKPKQAKEKPRIKDISKNGRRRKR